MVDQGKDGKTGPWRVNVDLIEGRDFVERYDDEEAAMERAGAILTSDYVVTQGAKAGTGERKLTLYPVHQIKSVTVDYNEKG